MIIRNMVTHAQVVIVGSGIVGSAVAYHLAKLGWKDLVLLDMGDLHENPAAHRTRRAAWSRSVTANC